MWLLCYNIGALHTKKNGEAGPRIPRSKIYMSICSYKKRKKRGFGQKKGKGKQKRSWVVCCFKDHKVYVVGKKGLTKEKKSKKSTATSKYFQYPFLLPFPFPLFALPRPLLLCIPQNVYKVSQSLIYLIQYMRIYTQIRIIYIHALSASPLFPPLALVTPIAYSAFLTPCLSLVLT